MKNKSTYFVIGGIVVAVIALAIIITTVINNNNKKARMAIIESDFNLEVLQKTNEKNSENYLVSPYSMELALAMLRDGAKGNTRFQIEKNIGNNTEIINNESVHIANAIFIKDDYKDIINKDYLSTLNNTHKADALYDKFEKPDVINNWVNQKTNGMIPSLLNDMSKDFVLGLANALAIDVEWAYKFDGGATRKAEFTKKDNTKLEVNMMHNTYETEDVQYIKSDKAQGIIIPYEEKTDLEFIAIMPNNDIDDYIKKLSNKEFEKLENSKQAASNKLHINLGLPKFSYSYDYNGFMDMLKEMGIKDVFEPKNADLTNIISRDDINSNNMENIYVSTAIHKTFIDLNENGTKAAAVTYFGVDKAAGMLEDYETINISFNKPFLYMIRDKKNNKLLFTGVVYEPSKYTENTKK